MIKAYVGKRIRRFEKKHLPNLRHNKTYKAVTFVLLVPIAFTTAALDKLIALIPKKQKPNRYQVNLKNIVDGFTNLAFPNPEIERVAHMRADICSRCPFAVKTGVYSIVSDNRTKTIQGMKCSECGCNLSAKVRSINDSCPLGKW